MLTWHRGEKWIGAAWLPMWTALSLVGAACGSDGDPLDDGYATDASSVGAPATSDAGGTSGPAMGNPGAGSGVDSGMTSPVVAADASVADTGVVQVPSDAGGQSEAGQGTLAEAGAGAGEAGAAHEDLGKGDGHDVITIGDSWMNYGGNLGGIERGLLAASGQSYRTFGVAGTKLLDEVIPNQYETAKQQNPDIKTVVMTGGGNDILLGFTLDSAMTIIDKIAARLDKLWQEMGADGVQDVIYIEYSEGGMNGDNVRYGIEKVQPVCDNATALRCHFMLSDPIIMMQLQDGVHPTQDGCTALGKAAYDLMEQEGMRR